MKKALLLITLLFSVNLISAKSEAEKVGLVLMEEFDPQGYAYYRYGDGIFSQGKQIAQSIAGQLDNFRQLTATDDPKELIADFKNKMNNIDLLQQELDQQATDLFYSQADQLGN